MAAFLALATELCGKQNGTMRGVPLPTTTKREVAYEIIGNPPSFQWSDMSRGLMDAFDWTSGMTVGKKVTVTVHVGAPDNYLALLDRKATQLANQYGYALTRL